MSVKVLSARKVGRHHHVVQITNATAPSCSNTITVTIVNMETCHMI